MIIINGNEYDNIVYDVSLGDYSVTSKEKKRTGISPFLSFKCGNIYIGIETTYDIKWIKELSNTSVDITSYITDISYEDENGWISLINGDFNCLISKKNNDIRIEFNYRGEEDNRFFQLYIDEIIKI